MSENEEKIRAYLEILSPILTKLRTNFSRVINGHKDVTDNITKFLEAVEELDNARRLINSAEKLGILVTINSFLVVPFPLSGDPDEDLGQTPIDLPES